MKILEKRQLASKNNTVVQFIRIDPEDLNTTLSEILKAIMDLSWLHNFDKDYVIKSFQKRAAITIQDIKAKLLVSEDNKITKDAGEYVVSELAREALINELKYVNIPLAELLGKKVSGNPGFDFHSQNPTTETVIFGEAKYISSQSAYRSAISQICRFIDDEKDIKDIADLIPFCTDRALGRASNGNKGFAAAFSAKRTNSDAIIASVMAMDDYKELLKYDEIILVAVNL